MNAVVEVPQSALAEANTAAAADAQPRGGLSVVEYAVRSGAPVSEVRALVELQIQMDNHRLLMQKQQDDRDRELRADAARNAFTEALAKFKAKDIKIIKDKDITDGPLKGKKHATVSSATKAVTEALSEFGLSATWRTVQDDKDWIKIACVVKHVAGYSEEVAFGGPVDTGAGRNAIQARKSTVSYLERITLELALGLAEHDDDDDGRGGERGQPRQGDAADPLEALRDAGRDAAMQGMAALTKWWASLNPRQQKDLSPGFGAMRKAARLADEGGAQ